MGLPQLRLRSAHHPHRLGGLKSSSQWGCLNDPKCTKASSLTVSNFCHAINCDLLCPLKIFTHAFGPCLNWKDNARVYSAISP